MTKETKSGIYQIRHMASSKVYVGCSGDLTKRWSEHRKKLALGIHHSRYLQNAWKKYGASAFEFSVIEIVPKVRSELIIREQFWIDSLHAYGLGYNMSPTAGSPLGFKHSAETRAKVSAAGRGRKLSPEHCAIISARAKAADHSFMHSPEARAKAAAKLRGQKRSLSAIEATAAKRRGMKLPPEWRAAIAAAVLGRKCKPFTAEHCAKISAGLTGKSPSFETREKMSASAKRRGAPKLTREQIDASAAKRRGAKRTPEQRARMIAGRIAARQQFSQEAPQ